MHSDEQPSPSVFQVLATAHKHLCTCATLYLAATSCLLCYSLSIPLRGSLLKWFVSFIQHQWDKPNSYVDFDSETVSVQGSCPCRDPSPDTNAFFMFVALFVLLYAIEASLLSASCHLIFRTITGMEANLRQRTFNIVSQGLPGILERFPASDLQVIFSTDIALERRFAVNLFWGLMYGSFQVVFGLAFMAAVDWRSTLLALVMFAIFWFGLPTAAALHLSMRSNQALGKVVASFDNMVDCLPVVRACNIAETLQVQFREDLQPYTDITLQSETTAGRVQTVLTQGLSLYSTIVTLILGYSVYAGDLTIGEYFAFLHTFTSVLSPARGLADFCRQALTFGSSVRRVDELFRASEGCGALKSSKGIFCDAMGSAESGCTIERCIRFEGVVFSYPGSNNPILRGVTCSIPAKSYTCVVGSSGSGKTTMLRLLMGELSPKSGCITFDEVDISTMATRELLSLIGVVFQEHHILNGTVMHNIRCGHGAASDDECAHAAKSAGIHNTINQLPHNYNTRLGMVDSDVQLSGGQKQRLCFSRALVRHPQLLLLDEATGDVDMETEAHILEEVHRLVSSGCATVISITHRLHTTRDADCIIVLQDGVVAEVGTYDELIDNGKTFAKMLQQESGRQRKGSVT